VSSGAEEEPLPTAKKSAEQGSPSLLQEKGERLRTRSQEGREKSRGHVAQGGRKKRTLKPGKKGGPEYSRPRERGFLGPHAKRAALISGEGNRGKSPLPGVAPVGEEKGGEQ